MSWPFSSCPLLLVSYLSKTASSHFCSLMYACIAWVSVVWVSVAWCEVLWLLQCCRGAAEALLRERCCRAPAYPGLTSAEEVLG